MLRPNWMEKNAEEKVKKAQEEADKKVAEAEKKAAEQEQVARHMWVKQANA